MMRATERNKLEVGIAKFGEAPNEHEQNKIINVINVKLWNSDSRKVTLGGIGSCDVFWYPCDGGMTTRRRPPTLMDFTAASIPGITCRIIY
jgi:hypothetical protein